jgi:AraC-like DNA-binding protein
MDILFVIHRRSGGIESRAIGAMTESISVPDSPDEEYVAVRFLPGGAYPFFRIPATELTDQSIELALLNGAQQARDISEQISETDDRVAVLESYLLQRLRETRPADPRFLALTHAIWRNPCDLTVDSLTGLSGLSSRQLERKFLQQVGIGPKTLLRVLRFQKATRIASAIARPNWTAIAADCGYFDQAHLIRDFRKFTGHTPRGYFSGRMSDFSNSRTRT